MPLLPKAPAPTFGPSAEKALHDFLAMFGPVIAQLQEQIAHSATSATVKADMRALASIAAAVGSDTGQLLGGNAAAAVSLKVDLDRLHPAILKVRGDARSAELVAPLTEILAELEMRESALRAALPSPSPPPTKGKPMGFALPGLGTFLNKVSTSAAAAGQTPDMYLQAQFAMANANHPDAALVAISAPPPAPSAGSSGLMAFLEKKVVGPVNVGEIGIGAAAIAAVTKLMKVW